MVEFAVVIPVLLLVVFGALFLGRALSVSSALASAASEGARTGIVSANEDDPVGIVDAAVRGAAPHLDETGLLTVTVDSTWEVGDPVVVTASFPVSFSVLDQFEFEREFTSTRTMRVAN